MPVLRALLLAVALPLAAVHAVAAASLVFTSPTPEETVHDNNGRVDVTLALQGARKLPEGVSVRLLLDGEAVAPDDASLVFQLNGVDRGTHHLQALLVDPQGRIVARSGRRTFYLHHASRLF